MNSSRMSLQKAEGKGHPYLVSLVLPGRLKTFSSGGRKPDFSEVLIDILCNSDLMLSWRFPIYDASLKYRIISSWLRFVSQILNSWIFSLEATQSIHGQGFLNKLLWAYSKRMYVWIHSNTSVIFASCSGLFSVLFMSWHQSVSQKLLRDKSTGSAGRMCAVKAELTKRHRKDHSLSFGCQLAFRQTCCLLTEPAADCRWLQFHCLSSSSYSSSY